MENKIIKKNSKRGCLIGAILFLAALILMVVIIASLKKPSTAKEPTNKENTVESKNKENAALLRFNDDGSFKLDVTRGTDEAITEMYNKAKEDCDSYYDIPYVIEKLNTYMLNPWENQNVMEQLIYFGTVIDKNKYSTDEEKAIGNKFVTVVKYVYRGVETIDDAIPGRNILLSKLKEYIK